MPKTPEQELAAARKTIAALMAQVEEKVGGGSSAFALLEQGIALERVVADRTAALEAEHAALAKVNAELRRTQAELVQSQKLEAVGRLAAGIAHEINTPIQFVSDSVDFVQEAFQDSLRVLAAYRELRAAVSGGGPVPAAVLEAIAAEEEAVGFSYIMDQVPKALERSIDGLSRVAVIVRAMKEFAHPDDKEKAPADLNAALRSTITIARNEYKYVAELESDLGQLPQVPCHLGELNQVFLNLIVNAAHAIGDVKTPGHKGRIRVQTRLDGDQVRVSISDNGAGIPDEIRHRIFEPFFTTKGVGKGTGQGLAIARSVVVEKHGGALSFESQPGAGTTFHVCIPVEAKVSGSTPEERSV